MRRVGARRRVGGKALASGADGCVFDKRFNEDGTTVEIPGIVSKVFPFEKASVAKNEFAIINAVKNTIPDGKGVVISNAELKTIQSVSDTIGDKARTGMFPNACGRVMTQKTGVFYVIEYPRIDGSMIDLNTSDVPISFFDEAIEAVTRLSRVGLIHTDVAARNIFVKGDKALLGDFGNMININDKRNLSATIGQYLSRNSITSIGDCLTSLGTSSTSRIAMLLYATDDLPSLQSEIRDSLKSYKTDSTTTYEFTDFYFEAGARPFLRTPLTEEMKSYLETMLKINSKSEIEPIMISELQHSDIRMLALVMAERCKPSKELETKVLEVWDLGSWRTVYLQGRLTRLRKGGRRTRRKRVKMSRRNKWETRAARPEIRI